jgi:hypothetical protein
VGERHTPDAVLTRARKRLDEWHELQEVIPSLDLQPRLVLDLAATEVTLDKERWRTLTAIDGRRNLRAIGRVLNISDFDVCRIVRSLLDDGIVELEGITALSASTRDAMPVVPPPEAAGLERVLVAGTVAVARPDLTSPPTAAEEPPPIAPPGGEPAAPPDASVSASRPPAGEDTIFLDPDATTATPVVSLPPEPDATDGRRGRRVIRIRSRQPDPERA